MTRTRVAGRAWIVGVALLALPPRAWGQAGDGAGADAAATVASPPGVSVSGGLGPMQSQGRYVTMGVAAVQIGVRRQLVIEPEFARWVEADAPGFHAEGGAVFATRRRAVTMAGANVLFRAGTSRVAGFAGGGAGVSVTGDRFDNPVDPRTGLSVGGPAVTRSATRLRLQGIGGADLVVAPRVHAFVAVRGEVQPDLNIGVTGGLRWVLRVAGSGPRASSAARASASASALGRTVEVLHLDGRRVSGRLRSLSAGEVVIDNGGTDQRIQLTDVRRVRWTSHWARNLALAGAAVFGGLAIGYCAVGDCGPEGLGYLAVEGAIATGAGLAIGAMIDSSSAARRTIYP